MTPATLLTERKRPAVRLERHLTDPPQVVWRALTDRAELHSWFPCDVIVEGGSWAPGARIAFPFDPKVMDLTLQGEVLEVVEPHVLSYTWGEELLRFELSPNNGGTLLVLIDELPANAAARNAAGWEDCLDLLAGRKPAEGAWQTRFAQYRAAFEPALGQQDGPPPEYKGG
jgi:uncharacterized protein YndB with AHSA1/START domain